MHYGSEAFNSSVHYCFGSENWILSSTFPSQLESLLRGPWNSQSISPTQLQWPPWIWCSPHQGLFWRSSAFWEGNWL